MDPSNAVCIDAHDLVVSKLVAGREKDIEFAVALIRAKLISAEVLFERIKLLAVPNAVIKRIRISIVRCSATADQPPKVL